jgi:hypothetical protein
MPAFYRSSRVGEWAMDIISGPRRSIIAATAPVLRSEDIQPNAPENFYTPLDLLGLLIASRDKVVAKSESGQP